MALVLNHCSVRSTSSAQPKMILLEEIQDRCCAV